MGLQDYQMSMELWVIGILRLCRRSSREDSCEDRCRGCTCCPCAQGPIA